MRRLHRRVRAILGSTNLWTAITPAAGFVTDQTGVAIDVRPPIGPLADALQIPSNFNGSQAGMRSG